MMRGTNLTWVGHQRQHWHSRKSSARLVQVWQKIITQVAMLSLISKQKLDITFTLVETA